MQCTLYDIYPDAVHAVYTSFSADSVYPYEYGREDLTPPVTHEGVGKMILGISCCTMKNCLDLGNELLYSEDLSGL